MTNVIGEDRSSFQPVSSWSGDYFGIAKAAEGTGWQDPTFAANWANLKAAGIPRGAYHFFHPADDPVQQADFAWDVVQAQGWEDGDFIVADVEILSGVGGAEDYGTARAAARAHTGLRAAAAPHLQQVSLGALTLEFLQRLSVHAGPQHRVMLYTDLYMATSLLGACSGYPLFIAYYEPGAPNSVAPWMNWTMWQNGALGLGGGDLDYFAGDAALLNTWCHPGKSPLPPDWTYPEPVNLTAHGGTESVALKWSAGAQPASLQPMPAIREYEIAIAEGTAWPAPDAQSYPRFKPKGTNPETWQGGSLKRKTTYTAAVRALRENPPDPHASPWATAVFATT